MRHRLRPAMLVLLTVVVPAAVGMAAEASEPGAAADAASVPPIREVEGVAPLLSGFAGGGWKKPIVIRSEADAAAQLSERARVALRKQVDFARQVVLVFAWRGSGQDRLRYAVMESYPEQVVFRLKPGRTRDLRPHVQVYALRTNVAWSVADGRSRPGPDADTPVSSDAEALAAARKHPRYRDIYEARNVLVATLDKAKAGPVAMSYPPLWGFDLVLTVREVLRGALRVGQKVRCGYSLSAPEKPTLPVGKACLVLLSIRRGGTTVHLLEEATDDLVGVARLAVAEAKKADEVNATLANEHPEKHPLYAALKQADGVVVVEADPEGVVSHDRRGVTTQSQVCVASLKGRLKPGARFQAVFPAAVAPQGRMPDADRFLLAYRRVGETIEVTAVAEASETNLRVAAAATGAPPPSGVSGRSSSYRRGRGEDGENSKQGTK